MKHAVQTFVEGVVQMYALKAPNGQVPGAELGEFIDLLHAMDWSAEERPIPSPATITGLRHMQNALAAAYAEGPCPIVDALRLCIGVTPWETYYADSVWSQPFLHEFASGELIGPNGFFPSSDVSLGLFLLGPNTTYTEHAHTSSEVYYILCGTVTYRIGDPQSPRTAKPGDLIYTAPNERHDIQTGDTPMLAVYTWKGDPSATSYHYDEGPWLGGILVHPPLVNRG
ncbi:dimethylsulfonioproprionate lyase family protein [Aestuariibius sp. 2305UL40-4]|uniref:dimethylsulfonioproprionate lyase family protein n=1 Tax=Aestuariibius violaceus TaxID=3234132 RepID=UPI00345EE880